MLPQPNRLRLGAAANRIEKFLLEEQHDAWPDEAIRLTPAQFAAAASHRTTAAASVEHRERPRNRRSPRRPIALASDSNGFIIRDAIDVAALGGFSGAHLLDVVRV